MKIFLATDHRGYELKEKIKIWLDDWKVKYEDMGNFKYEKIDDYPDFAKKAGEAVSKGKGRGIVICGSGVGVSIVVNKFNGVRGMIGFAKKQVEHGVEYDHVNVLGLAADYFEDKEIKEMVKVFLKTRFGKQERNIRRVNKIKKIEGERIYYESGN